MASQAELLLWALATLAVAIGALNAPRGLRWAWGYYVQLAAVLALCVAGLTVGPRVPFAVAAWALFSAIHVGVTFLLRRWAHLTMVDADVDRAARLAGLLALLSWGPPARLRAAELAALRLAKAGDRASALALLAPYLGPEVAAPVRTSAATFAMSLFRFDEGWDEAVTFSERLDWPKGKPVPHAAAFVAARAHLELGQFEQATACMARAEMAEVGLPPATLDVYRLPFAALMGDLDAVEAIARRLGPRQALLTQGWVVRCLVVQGRYDEAKAALDALLLKLPPTSLSAERMRVMRDRLEAGLEAPAPQPTPAERGAADALFAQASQSSVVFQAARPSRLVIGLVSLNISTFITLEGLSGVGHDRLHEWFWNHGVMWWPGVVAGQWWRLLTHQFMHLHLTHLALNMATLWVLGAMAVRLVGARWFLPLYLLSGVVAAIAQGIAAPDTVCLGASGAIFGALGMVAVAVLRDRGALPQRWRKRFLRRLVAVLLLQLGADWLIPGVAALDHLAGLVAGALLTCLIPLPMRPEARPEAAPRAEAA